MTTQTRFTPGPWSATPDNYNGDVVMRIRGDDRSRLLFTLVYPGSLLSAAEKAETAANGYLIASAPDLYAALEHLFKLLEPMEQDGRLQVPGLATLNGARAALRKARGEA